MAPRIVESAEVSVDAQIGDGTSIWHLVQVRENAKIGRNCIVGRAAYIGEGVEIGDNCKIQNLALVYEPAKLEKGVFIGPAVVLTNDQYPRAINEDGSLKSASDWEPVGVTVREGAAIGARSVLVAPVEIGAWSLVAAGSTVVKDVPAFALVAGTPAKQIGWVGKAGHKLVPVEGKESTFECPKTGQLYVELNGELKVNND
ncbi:acyltransferase [Corynebacterium minutissimum]|uniref:acyltransferase n=1 Tax=Corynebacterium minutissimum TaxID=38301 RepID=UPI001EF37081|nr:N-acetyltransferase [Corynebacterium minutissimum]MCG7238051.1 N-acetyltransferase [Corynebacterium minutissimum]